MKLAFQIITLFGEPTVSEANIYIHTRFMCELCNLFQ
jgi:hypothetical protein